MAYLPPLNGGRVNATISGNTAGAGALVSSGTMSLAGGNNITLSQAGNAITISGANSPTASINFSAGTTSNSLSAVTFSNSNGVSFGLNGSVITGSVAAQTNQTLGLYALGNTTQSSSGTRDARSLSFNGLGGVSVGYSNGSYQISGAQTVAQTNQTVGLYALGNTTQNSSTTLDARSLSFNGLGAASVGYSNGSVQLSVPAQTVQTQSNIQALYDGASSISTGTVRLSNANGVSFGVNGQTITASHNGITSQSNQNISLYALGNTTQNSSTLLNASNLSFNGLGGVSVGYSNGSVQISGATGGGGGVALYDGVNSITSGTARVLAVGGLTASINGQTLSLSVPGSSSLSATGAVSISTNGSTISIGAPAFSAGISTIGNTSGTSGTVSNQLVLAGGNNVTLSQATGAGGNTLTISAASQTNQTMGLYAVSNTTQNSSTTMDARTLSFQGAGIASVGYSNGSVVVSVPSGAPSPVNFSAGTTSNNLASVVFSNSNGVSFGLNGSTVTASAAGGGGIALANSQTTYTSGTAKLNVAGGAMTIASTTGQSFNFSVPATSSLSATGAVSLSSNGSTISIGAPAYTFSGSGNVSVATAGSTVTISDNKRVGSTTSSATPTINTDSVDVYKITALAANITSFTTNLSGTPIDGQTLWIVITDNGTSRSISWGSSFEASTVALPTATTVSTRLDVGFVWNTSTSKWRCVATA